MVVTDFNSSGNFQCDCHLKKFPRIWVNTGKESNLRGSATRDSLSRKSQEQWMSSISVALLDACKSVLLKQRTVKRLDLWNVRQQWLIDKRREMGKATSVGNGTNLYWLTRNIGPRKLSVSKVIRESEGTPTHSREHRRVLWRERFREQFRWPIATVDLPIVLAIKPMHINTSMYPKWR